MSNRIFGREIELTLNNRVLSSRELTIYFETPFDDTPDDNTTKITIYNLSDDTLADIGATPRIIINAGYGDDVGAVFLGFADTVKTEWNGVDKVTTIEASDGAGQYYKQMIRKTYARNTKASFIVQDIQRITGIQLGEMDFKRDYVYTKGKAIKGGIIEVLKSIAKDCGSKIYSRNGQVFFRVPGNGKVIGFVLDAEHGLIGSPSPIQKEIDVETTTAEKTPTTANSAVKNDAKGKGTEKTTPAATANQKKKLLGYKVQLLMNHQITTDSVIEIKSKTANGVFRVYNGKHVANGNDFITEVEVYS